MKELPQIPNSWIIVIVCLSLVVLRAINIDTYVTAGIATIIGYLTGVKLEQTRKCKK